MPKIKLARVAVLGLDLHLFLLSFDISLSRHVAACTHSLFPIAPSHNQCHPSSVSFLHVFHQYVFHLAHSPPPHYQQPTNVSVLCVICLSFFLLFLFFFIWNIGFMIIHPTTCFPPLLLLLCLLFFRLYAPCFNVSPCEFFYKKIK